MSDGVGDGVGDGVSEADFLTHLVAGHSGSPTPFHASAHFDIGACARARPRFEIGAWAPVLVC